MEEKIITIITNLVRNLGIAVEEVSTTQVAGQKIFKIASADGKRLIGMRGDTIRSLDHLVKKIAEHQGVEDTHFLVDVNDYRTKQIEDLQNKARMMAERARSFEYDVELNPMTSYERLIVHATLADIPNVLTESHGEGRNRRVVIRYQAAEQTA